MRRSYKEEAEQGVSVTIKLPASLVTKIDEYWKENDFSSRTHYFEESAAYYLSALRCDNCGALNPPGSSYCAVCQTPIGEYSKKRGQINKIFSDIENEIRELYQKYYAVLELELEFNTILQKYSDKDFCARALKTSFKTMQENREIIANTILQLNPTLIHEENEAVFQDLYKKQCKKLKIEEGGPLESLNLKILREIYLKNKGLVTDEGKYKSGEYISSIIGSKFSTNSGIEEYLDVLMGIYNRLLDCKWDLDKLNVQYNKMMNKD